MTTTAVAAIVLVLVAWLLTYSRSTGSRQYVSGAAGQQGSVSVGTRAVDLYARQGGAKSPADISDTCFYKTGRGVVMVPIHVRGRGEGAMTFHVTTMIAKDGAGGGRVVRSVVSDVPFMGTMLSEQIWARIPLDHSVWNGGATHCRVRWTMTPGAWFTED